MPALEQMLYPDGRDTKPMRVVHGPMYNIFGESFDEFCVISVDVLGLIKLHDCTPEMAERLARIAIQNHPELARCDCGSSSSGPLCSVYHCLVCKRSAKALEFALRGGCPG